MTTKDIYDRLYRVCGEMGYSKWSIVMFDPIKTFEEDKEIEYSHILSGIGSNDDLVNLGHILIRMLEKMVEKGYVKYKDDKGQINA